MLLTRAIMTEKNGELEEPIADQLTVHNTAVHFTLHQYNKNLLLSN